MTNSSSSSGIPSGQFCQASVDGDVLILKITAPEIRTPQDSQGLRDEMLGYVEQLGKTRIIIDLEPVRFIASAGLLGFLSVRRRISTDGPGEIVMCQISDDLRVLLEVCRLIPEQPGLAAAFQAAPSREAALEMLRGS